MESGVLFIAYFIKIIVRFVTNFNYTFGCFSKNRIDIYKNIIQSIEDYIITSEKLEVSFDAVRCALQWSPW